MAIAHVRSASATYNGTTSATATLAGTTASGNLIIVYATCTDGPTTINTPTDNSSGNTYTAVSAQATGSLSDSRVWYAKNVTGKTGFAVTVTLTNGQFGGVIVHEVSGADTTSPLDQFISNAQTTIGTGANAVTSTAKTTTANGEYIFGATVDENFGSPTITSGTGFTAGESSINDSGFVFGSEYQVQTSAGSIAATFTHNTTSDVVTWLATFKAAAAAATDTTEWRFNPPRQTRYDRQVMY